MKLLWLIYDKIRVNELHKALKCSSKEMLMTTMENHMDFIDLAMLDITWLHDMKNN